MNPIVATLVSEIDDAISRLQAAKRAILSTTPADNSDALPTPGKAKKKTMSAAVKRKIGLASKKRWAERKAEAKK